MDISRIVEMAFVARKNAYAPYSNFKVGACVMTKDGKFFGGANIENASYGLTNCAERSACFAAYSAGYRKEDIEMLAVVTDAEKLTTPCGACRQVLSELLCEDTPIVLSNKKETVVTNIKELLPSMFGAEDLNK